MPPNSASREAAHRRSAAALLLLAVAGGCSSSTTSSTPDRATSVNAFPARYVIEVTGSRNLWQVRYPDPAGPTRPAKQVTNVRNIHVPAGTQVVLALSSTDYVYTLAIPDYGLKEIAVPEHEFRMEFRPRTAGRLNLVGEHLCGDPFSAISGQLVVEPPDAFRAWLRK